MQSFLRVTLLIMFGGGGVALAFALVSMSDPASSPAAPVLSIQHAAALEPTSTKPSADLPSLDLVEAQPASVQPPVTQDVLVAQKPAASPSSQEAQVPVSTFVDLMEKVMAAQVPASQPAPAATPSIPDVQLTGSTSELSAEEQEAQPRFQDEGDDRLTLHANNSDLREVLEIISQGGNLNILASRSVEGTVSASLTNVDVMTALNAILKSSGYLAYREGEIIFVSTPEEYRQRKQSNEEINTRLYRPDYVTASELQQLVIPLLTPDVGTISISSAAEQGIASDSTSAGGDNFSGNEVVLIRDFESVLAEVDMAVEQIDCRPLQVAIEAMILSVKLGDKNELGVDFELLKNKDHIRLVSGSPPSSLASISADSGGLKVGFLDSSVTMFLDALETIGDTNVVASPKLLVLNKQKAEILIGEQLGYVSTTVTETAVTQSVEFLEVGTQLRIRPFISSDGQIRMEVHPELSTGSVRVEQGFTLPDKEVTEVTTNVMAHDGATVVIGGLIREDLSSTRSQIPLLGSVPLIGPLFRQSTEKIDRREILVLITPRIVSGPELAREGDHGATEFHHRQAIVAEKFNPITRLAMARRYFYKAQTAWAEGNGRRAMKMVNLSIHYNPESRAAIDLRADIWAGNPIGDHTEQGPYVPEDALHPLNGRDVAPWLLDDLSTPSTPTGQQPPSPQPNTVYERLPEAIKP